MISVDGHHSPGKSRISRNLGAACVMVPSTMRCGINSTWSIAVPMRALTISFCSQLLPSPWELSRKCLESLAKRTIRIEAMWWTWMLTRCGRPIARNFSACFHPWSGRRQINYGLHFVIQPKPAAMHRSAQSFAVKSGNPIELNMQWSICKTNDGIEKENALWNFERKILMAIIGRKPKNAMNMTLFL